MSAPWPPRAFLKDSRAVRSTITEPTENERSTSGTAEQLASVLEPISSASTLRMPSDARAGTIVRDPASGFPKEPASSTTTASSDRIAVHDPRPTAIESTTTTPSPIGVREAARWPFTIPDAMAAVMAAAHRRQRSLGCIHATATQTSIAAATHGSARPVAEVDHGTAAAVDAVHPSARTQSTDMPPANEPTAPEIAIVPMATTPPIVAIAAGGMVTMLSGAASHAMDPEWCSAIGVLVLQATSAAHDEAMAADTAISRTSGTRLPRRIAAMAAMAPRCHLAVTAGATTSNAITTP